MIFEIKRADNGLMLTVKEKEDDADTVGHVVYQEKEDDEVECFADFLCYLNEKYGPSTGRYSEKRIYIRVEPGDKWGDGRLGPTASN